ncbi:PABS domain-containing protein [Balamuthia mandrillaris]
MQSSTYDEYMYHESLVQPIMCSHPNPKTVFIGGGGEGATAREVLRHKTVEKCVMVDIDQDVVEACKKHLPQHHKGAWNDKRLELHYDDAKKILENYPEKFDVIILDLADPLEAGPCYLLYTVEFYEMCKTKLNPGGLLVTQSGPGGALSMHQVFTPVAATLRKVFPHVVSYSTYIASFGDEWGFNIASESEDVQNITAEEVDRRIAERIEGGAESLRYYDGTTHRHKVYPPKHLSTAIAKETRTITADTPLFLQTVPTAEHMTASSAPTDAEEGAPSPIPASPVAAAQ